MFDPSTTNDSIEDRRVAIDTIEGFCVSTVRLHPLLSGGANTYETMVFDHRGQVSLLNGAWAELYVETYKNLEAAQAGHKDAIAWLHDNLEELLTYDIPS